MTKTFDNELDEIQRAGLTRRLRAIEGPQGPWINIDGRDCINLCSNDYLGLAADPRLSTAAQEAMAREGWGAGASRLVCGNMSAHRQLEEKMRQVKGTEACLLFGSGYMANTGIIPALCGPGDLILSDRLNHASIIDGIMLSRASFKRYAHNDMTALERILSGSAGSGRRLIVSDAVFSMDGDIASLEALCDLAQRYDCLLMLDEAHSFGVFGSDGAGLAAEQGVSARVDIQMGTFSKAAGSYGAYCCASQDIVNVLIQKARSVIYTTGLPPAVAAASLKAVEIITEDVSRRDRLWTHTRWMRDQLQTMGFDTMDSVSPVIPILVKSADVAVDFSARLFQQGILVAAIRPPTVPRESSRLRLTVTAGHEKEDLQRALEVIRKVAKELCLI